MTTVAGYFRWTRGIHGPCPEKIDADMAQYGHHRMIMQVALTPEEYRRPLADLARDYDHLKGETS